MNRRVAGQRETADPGGRAGSGQIGWGRESGIGLVAHAIAGPLDNERLGVMQQAVEQR